jgi:5'-nucleotidase
MRLPAHAAIAACLALAATAAAAPVASTAPATPLELRVIALNDFHGHLQPEPYAFDTGAPAEPAGGAVALAATLARLRAQAAHSLFVSTGDLVGASPLPSALAHDEPTLRLFQHLGLQANAIGNHELDAGLAELQRQQALAGFPFLSANLVDAGSGAPVFAPYRIVEVEGVRIAFVGATVRSALQPLEPDSVPGLRLDDEAAALNAQAALLRALGVHALVALLHEGAAAQGARVDAAGCDALSGPARAIAEQLDPDFDLVLSAHTHALYACQVKGRWLAQGGANGRYLTVADLQLDRASGDVVAVSLRNEAVRASDDPADPAVATLVADAVAAAAKIADAPVARLPSPRLSASADDLAGSPLGRLLAQAQLAAGAKFGATLACTNPSSVPHELQPSLPGNTASYGDLRGVQPYGNHLKVREVTGAQLHLLLGQQSRDGAAPALLSCAPRLGYGPAGGVSVGARRIGAAQSVRMVVNSYLARGGQGFDALVGAKEVGDAGLDLDALVDWLRKHGQAKR